MLPTVGKPASVPFPIVPTFRRNWPIKSSSLDMLDPSLLQPAEDDAKDEDEPVDLIADDGAESENLDAEDVAADEDDDGAAAGWDMGDDDLLQTETFADIEAPAEGASGDEGSLWARNSVVAADHVAGGSFSTAMQLLQRQVGAVNFAPLESRFLEIYRSTRTFLPAGVELPPLINHVRRTIHTAKPSQVLPAIPRGIDFVQSELLTAGFKAMDSNKLEDGVRIFRDILHLLMVNVAETEEDEEEVSDCCCCVFVTFPILTILPGQPSYPDGRAVRPRDDARTGTAKGDG